MANDHTAVFEGEKSSNRSDSPSLEWRIPRREIELLGHERRRKTIRILENDDETTLDRREIARRIAAIETDADAASDELVRRVELSLHHKHLPMLDDHGVVDYDRDTGLVAYAPSQAFERRVLAAGE